jgi:hypothetical protein
MHTKGTTRPSAYVVHNDVHVGESLSEITNEVSGANDKRDVLTWLRASCLSELQVQLKGDNLVIL